MSGTAFLDGLKSLEEIVGPEISMQARSQLTAAQALQLEQATSMTWIPIETASALYVAAGAHAGRDVDLLVDEVVRRTAERLLRGIWRVLTRFTSDEALIKRTPALWSRWRNVGQLQSRMLGTHHAEVNLSGWPDVPDRHLRMLGMTNQVILELAGRRALTQQRTRTPEGGRFELRWNGS